MSSEAKNNPEESHDAAASETNTIRERLIQIANAAEDAGANDLQQLSASLVDLTVIAESSEDSPRNHELSNEIIEFFQETLPSVERSLETYPDSINQIQQSLETLEERWGEYLELLSETERFSNHADDAWTDSGAIWTLDQNHSDVSSTEAQYSVADMTKILAGLNNLETTEDPLQPAEVQVSFSSKEHHQPGTLPNSDLIQETLDDPELIPAYVDDAQKCLAGMEMCLMELDSNQQAKEPLRQFCRELHTLKGASGTVGLNNLAMYLHGLENRVDAMSSGGQEVNIDPLLEGVDFIRLQLEKLLPENSQGAPAPAFPGPSTTSEINVDATTEAYVRIEASRLDRLMDLLAELVMLRNRRETYVSSLQRLDQETNSCATRLRLVDSYAIDTVINSEQNYLTSKGDQQPCEHLTANHLTAALTEMAKDVADVGRQLREVCDPLSQDNSTISHLIGSFRSELMELRRQPIAGLFRRLYRVARDASKAEGRQVELHFVGQGTRAERALQDRLYEPLLHIIRNAVSHGIEPENDRIANGKPAIGQITLNSYADATSLYIEIRDDGRGLNEQVLEKKGRELGLLNPGSRPTKKQLWELILQPGFSTKNDISQISGRGVGMDVVASQVRSMRGRVSIDSVKGEQTTIRLEIPLRSTIEHAMIVRCGQQLFALPMHSVFGTQADEELSPKQKIVGLHHLLGIEGSEHAHRVVTLRNQNIHSETLVAPQEAQEKLSVAVDAVVGVEEVVVRSLPPLLRNHECFSGVTLSGEAETVLVLDVPRLTEFARQEHAKSNEIDGNDPKLDSRFLKSQPLRSQRRNGHHRQRLLIVDDSMTVRKNLIRKMEKHGFDLVEAADGKQALDILRDGEFDGIVSDIDMPRMNGIDFLTEVRRKEQFSNLPIVVLTSRRDAESLDAVRKLNVRRTFTKPVSDTLVKSIVQSIRHQPMTSS